MRVLFLTASYLPEVGGAERQLELLSRELQRRGHEVSIVTHRVPGAPVRETLNGVRIRRLFPSTLPAGLRSPVFIALTMLYLLVHGRRFDAVHCMSLSVHAVGVAVARPLWGFRWVVRMACAGPFGDLAPIRAGWRRRLMRWALNRAHKAVALSGDVAREMEQFGIARERIEIMFNAVDTERFQVVDRSYSEAGGLLFVGRLTEQKNVGPLIEALARPGLGECVLTLAGAGDQEEGLRRRAVECGVDDRVRFAGLIADMAPVYAEHDVFVLPSLGEGMSNALLEAMASGMPVVSTEASGTVDVVRPGRDGILVDEPSAAALAEALRRVCAASPAVRAEMGASARQRVLDVCGVESLVDRLVAAYGGDS